MQTPFFTQLGNHNLLWVTDPWSTLDQSKDTTLRLMLEAINMGIPTFWSASDQILATDLDGHILAVRVKKEDLSDLSKSKLEPMPLSSFQQIHYRCDPPVDDAYCNRIDELLARGAKDTQILNPPELIKNQSEKIPPKDLMEYAPRMMVIAQRDDLLKLSQLFQADDEIVSKPLHLAQSIGVQKHQCPKNIEGWKSLIDSLTENFTKEILIEEYLPEINSGEVRMWFAGEQFIAALKKYPKTGDFRVLIDEGSRVSAHTLTPDEIKIANKIGSSLKKQGILLAAIDLIGHKICDYNITSPGLLVQLEKVHGGQNFAKEILNQALKFRVQTAHE